jgi:DNA-binding transcriptional LysR family regulator
VIYSVGLQDMGFYTQQFNTHYPQAKIRLAFLHPNEVVEAVVNDEADIGILSFPTTHRSLKVIPWHDEPMVFVCHRSHALAKKKLLTAKDLADEKFIAFEKNLAIRKAIDRSLRQRGVRPETAMEFDNIETIKQAITIQSGVSILPRTSVSREVENGMVAAIPLDMPELVRPIGIIHRRQKLLTPITSKLIEFLQNVKR